MTTHPSAPAGPGPAPDRVPALLPVRRPVPGARVAPRRQEPEQRPGLTSTTLLAVVVALVLAASVLLATLLG